MIQAADFAKTLHLTELSPSTKTEWDIRTTDLNRPGMQFCGFYEYFAFERPAGHRQGGNDLSGIAGARGAAADAQGIFLL